MNEGYKLVQLTNGEHSVHSFAYGETMHPGVGPVQEAKALYVDQLKLRERLKNHHGEFVVWDVGTGGAANVLTFFRSTQDIKAEVRVVSFENTLEPLRFALENSEKLGYFSGYEKNVSDLLSGKTRVEFQNENQKVRWEIHERDFPALLKNVSRTELSQPHAIFFDPFSPKKNPAMWTAPLFADLFRLLDPQRPCSLATYSRSTIIRASLLLAGFFVGAGKSTGPKEETTIAANTLDLLDAPLDKSWLERARRSESAEPLWEPIYRQEKLSNATFEKIKAHPQFQ